MHQRQRSHRPARSPRPRGTQHASQKMFDIADTSAFWKEWRKYKTPTEVVRHGKTIGYWIPVAPRPAEARHARWWDEWNPESHKPPVRGSATWHKWRPYLEAIEEAEHNEKALRRAIADYRRVQREEAAEKARREKEKGDTS